MHVAGYDPRPAGDAVGQSSGPDVEWRGESTFTAPATDSAALPPLRPAPARLTRSELARLGSAADPAHQTLRLSLRTTKVHGLRIADEESLRVVVHAIRDSTGLPLVVTPAAEDAVLDAGVVFDFDLENPISVENLLNLITRMAGEEVVWTIRHEAVLVTTRAKAAGRLVFELHDIRTLTMARTDFIAPRIDRIRLLDDLEDDDGGGPFGGLGEHSRRFEEEDVATLVQENIAPESWDADGISIEAANGFLLVVHTREVQRRIARLLAALGA